MRACLAPLVCEADGDEREAFGRAVGGRARDDDEEEGCENHFGDETGQQRITAGEWSA